VVRRIRSSADHIGAAASPPRLVRCCRSDEETLAERARELLAEHAAEAEATLRKRSAPPGDRARRVMRSSAPPRNQAGDRRVARSVTDDESASTRCS